MIGAVKEGERYLHCRGRREIGQKRSDNRIQQETGEQRKSLFSRAFPRDQIADIAGRVNVDPGAGLLQALRSRETTF